MRKGVFIVGTGTGVGKTVVAAGLALTLKKRGWSIGVMKPVATGCSGVTGRLVSTDAAYLMEAAECEAPPLVSPVRFRNPVSPNVASLMEKVEVNLEFVKESFLQLEASHDFVIVEGIGGVLVPIRNDFFVTNLIAALELPVVLVTNAQLGTINHTLLSVEALVSRGIEIVGIIMNGLPDTNISLAEITNPKVVAELSGQPFLGTLPKMFSVDVENMQFGELQEVFERRIDIGKIIGE